MVRSVAALASWKERTVGTVEYRELFRWSEQHRIGRLNLESEARSTIGLLSEER